MITLGFHFNACLHAPAIKTGSEGLPRLNGAGSGSEPFAGLRDALAGAFSEESFPPYLRIRQIFGKEVGKGGWRSCRFLESGGWQERSTAFFSAPLFCKRTERSVGQ